MYNGYVAFKKISDMRRLDKLIIDPQIINQILNESDLCRLGLVDDGEAYIVPVNYAHHDGCLYFHSAKQGRKIEVLKRSEIISFEITYLSQVQTGEKACNWTTRYRSIMGRADVLFVHDFDEKTKALDLIMKKHGATGTQHYDRAMVDSVAILKLPIISLTAKQSGKWD